jgi:hypothetical protein
MYSGRSEYRHLSTPHRSARPRTCPGSRRCSRRLPLWAVQLRREESRCRLQNRVRPPQLANVTLQLRDPGRLAGRRAGPLVPTAHRDTSSGQPSLEHPPGLMVSIKPGPRQTADSLPHKGFRRWASTRPVPDRAASLLPGLLAATRTGLTPAGDDELQTRTRPLNDHLLITGRTGWSTRQGRAQCAPPCRRPARGGAAPRRGRRTARTA